MRRAAGIGDYSDAIQADHRDWQDTELEGSPVWIARYPLGNGYLTEIGCHKSGEIVARGSGATSEESFQLAVYVAVRRLRRLRTFDLTVGG